jgi:hypothetical protein
LDQGLEEEHHYLEGLMQRQAYLVVLNRINLTLELEVAGCLVILQQLRHNLNKQILYLEDKLKLEHKEDYLEMFNNNNSQDSNQH